MYHLLLAAQLEKMSCCRRGTPVAVDLDNIPFPIPSSQMITTIDSVTAPNSAFRLPATIQKSEQLGLPEDAATPSVGNENSEVEDTNSDLQELSECSKQ
jgi:hypothetical protein